MNIATISQPVTVEKVPAAIGNRKQVARWFYVGAALFMILLSVVGFVPSIVDSSRRNAPFTPLMAAHGIAAGAWLLFFLTQATLIETRRVAIHRRLGIFGAVVAVAMIVLGYIVTIQTARHGYDLSGDLHRALSRSGRPFGAAGFLFPLAELVNFGILVAAGLWCRHRPDIHKRLMLLATIALANEPILHLVGYLAGHWPSLHGAGIIISVPITILLLFTSAIHDRMSQGRVHPVSLWVPILLIAWQNAILVFVILPSTLWREFAAWLVR